MHSAIELIPGFPGIQISLFNFELWLIFQAMACSLPPDPISKTLNFTFIHKSNYNGLITKSNHSIIQFYSFNSFLNTLPIGDFGKESLNSIFRGIL